MEGKPAHEEKHQGKGQPDKGKQEKQNTFECEGKVYGEGQPEPQAKPESRPRAAEKCPAEDYVPQKATKKWIGRQTIPSRTSRRTYRKGI